ncbi:YhfT family protein [Vibrio anguillarum]|uniref:YhfT family protein n=1 Tax=Vibrio anguillarum TaxID=55601 RepID=UPI000423D2BC|nr:YhfT family protein [Vibrio anguillarum]
MDIMHIGLVASLCAMTALIANMSAAVFHDGIRPILPQLVEGNMTRREAGSVAYWPIDWLCGISGDFIHFINGPTQPLAAFLTNRHFRRNDW